MDDSTHRTATDDDLLDLLASSRRRAVLETLATTSGPMSLSELLGEMRDEGRANAVRVDLHHNHLPRLDRAGFVRYDPQEQVVDLTREPRQLAEDVERATADLHRLASTARGTVGD